MAALDSGFLDAMSETDDEEISAQPTTKRPKCHHDDSSASRATSPAVPQLKFHGLGRPACEVWAQKIIAIMDLELAKKEMLRPLNIMTGCSGTGAPCLALQVTRLANLLGKGRPARLPKEMGGALDP